MNHLIVFDTETTGIPDWKTPSCGNCGGIHKTIDHGSENVTYSARRERHLTKNEGEALWKALRKSTKLLRKGRLLKYND